MTTTKPRALGIMMAISLTLSGATAYSNRYTSSVECGNPGPDGLFVTREKFDYADIERACMSKGGSPADLNDENFPIASGIIQNCTGPEKLAWIGSWDYEPGSDDCQDCLSVFIGGRKPGGGIVDQNCQGPKPVICQVGTSVVKHDPNYQLGQDIPRKVSIVPHYGNFPYRGHTDYAANTPIYYPGYYGNRISPPHGPRGGYPGGVFPGGPGFGRGYDQNDWKKQTPPVGLATVTVTSECPAIDPYAGRPPKTVTVTEFAETILTNIEIVTQYSTQTEVSTDVKTEVSTNIATQYLTEYSTLLNTVTQDYTQLLTTTEVSVREGATVTLNPSTVTLDPFTVTQNGETVTLSASTITLSPGTVTLPPETVSLSPVTVTLPPVTTTKTLPPITSVVYAVRDNTITTTVFSRLPAITSFKTEYQVKYTTTTQQIPGPTVTQTVQQSCSTGMSVSESEGEWSFPFELPQFTGPGSYTLNNGAVITVKDDGSYTVLSGVLPSSAAAPVSGSAGPDYKFTFPFNSFNGPGLYTLPNGAVVTVKPGGSYTFLTGGPPGSSSSGSEVSFTFPFNVPDFKGPGLYTLSPGNVLTVKPDGSYTFLQGGPPTSANNNSGSGVSFSFPFDVPGFKGPGAYTLSPGNVVSIKPDGSYTFLQGGPPQSSGGGGGGGGTFSFPFDVPGFSGPGVYTLSPGNVVSIKPDGSYTFLQGGPPQSGGGGGGGGGTFSFPFDVPGFSGPGVYTLSPGNVVSIKPDGSYTFLQGGPPQSGGGGGGGGSISLPFNVPGFSGPGVYTLSPGNVVSIKNDGSYTFLQGGPPQSGGGGGGGGSISFPFNVPGFSGPGVYTLSPGNVVSIKNDGSYTFLQGGPPQSGGGGGGGGGGSISLPFNVPGFSGPGVYTLSPGNVVSIKNDGSYTFLQGGPPQSGGSNVNNGGSSGSISIPSQPGIYTLSNGAIVSVSSSGSYSFIQGGPNSSSSNSGKQISIPFNVPGFHGAGVYTLSPGNVVSFNSDGSYTFLQGGPPSGSTPVAKASVNLGNDVNILNYSDSGIDTLVRDDELSNNNEEEEEGEIIKLKAAQPSKSAEKSGFNLAAVSFPAFARRAIATFV